MSEPHLILGIGELLWDIVPIPPHLAGALSSSSMAQPPRMALLGGAPANFTVMAGRLGSHAVLLSRIGRDDLGRMAVKLLDPFPIDASALQIDTDHPTGRVTVEFVQADPRYTVHQPAAWDFLLLSDPWFQLAERAHAICFGSLAQRHEPSRRTIQELVATTSARCIRVFDVNLRPPFLSSEVLQESLGLATVVKMNQDELPEVLRLLGLPTPVVPEAHPAGANHAGANHASAGQAEANPAEANHAEANRHPSASSLRLGAARLLAEFPNLQLVAVTRADCGSLLVTPDEWHDHPGFPVQLVDPIGAGDAFTAALTHYLLKGAPLATLNQAGNRWGAWVASQSGAMPPLPDPVRSAVAASIES